MGLVALRKKENVGKPTIWSYMKVAVIDKNFVPCAPCQPARARELVRKNKAKRRFIKGIFYIQLKHSVLSLSVKRICLGLDPGSKRAGLTVMDEKETLLNILLNVENRTKEKLEIRRNMRRARRFRKTPCRKNRQNRKRNLENWIPPSTFSRWNRYLNIIKTLNKIYPISDFIVEDVKAKTLKNKKRWNMNFSPIQNGKNWFYKEIEKLGIKLHKIQGWETKELRDDLCLKKISNKLAEKFEAHCVDSWVIANSIFEKQKMNVDLKNMIVMTPFYHVRRQLHRFQPTNGGIRNKYGNTSNTLKKGTIVKFNNNIRYTGCFSSYNKKIELKNCYGKRTNRGVSLRNIQVIVKNNNLGFKYI